MSFKSIIQTVVAVALLGLLAFGLFNYQAISDWLRLRNYEPSARISAIADKTTMNESTRRLFYVNHPELSDKQAFGGQCQIAEQSIVLGCYVENQGIYLLDVEDKRLNGVVEVTAAHETLHAAYDRLSSEEKAKVDKMTADYFATIDNQRIQEVVASYKEKDPSVVPNELHSILGTEVRELPAELENYYKQYFKDRKAIVAMSEQYEQTFIGLRNQIDNLDQQLDTMRKQIEQDEAALEALAGELDSRRSELDSLLAAGDDEAYNRNVPGYNQRVDQYNQLINETKQLIARYNSTVETRNKLALVEQELVEQIDSSKLTEKRR